MFGLQAGGSVDLRVLIAITTLPRITPLCALGCDFMMVATISQYTHIDTLQTQFDKLYIAWFSGGILEDEPVGKL